MRCRECHELIDRLPGLPEAERPGLHRHLAECADCRARFDDATLLNERLGALGATDLSASRQRVGDRLGERATSRDREFRWSLAATVVCAGATAWFIAADETFGWFALLGTTLVLVFHSWRTQRETTALTRAADSDRGVAAWREELERELQHVARLGPIVAGMFAAMTTIVAFRHGLLDLRFWIFFAVCTSIGAFVLRQWVVRRPQIRQELELLGEFDG